MAGGSTPQRQNLDYSRRIDQFSLDTEWSYTEPALKLEQEYHCTVYMQERHRKGLEQ